MKILHSSDWHLGQNFMGKSRKEEHKAFFSWLIKTIKEEKIDVLIVAGDIFDTATPPNYALELYYNLLKDLNKIKNLYIIITAGNHDSIATLNAAKLLLESLNVHVITSGYEDENEIIEIKKDNKQIALICAVPFLRDQVVRKVHSAQTLNEKEFSLNEGIKEHYINVYNQALELRLNDNIPIISTGHLTTVGAKTSESEREIYIGGTLDISSDFLGQNFDYVALGHLHINQKVGCEHVRYSGSPIALSFSEAKQIKKINIINFTNKDLDIKVLDIPKYRELYLIKGKLEDIKKALDQITDKSSWIEIHLKDENAIYSNEIIREYAKNLDLNLLAVKIDKSEKSLKAKDMDCISLEELKPIDLFNKRLELEKLENKDLEEKLLYNFKTILAEVE